MIFQTIDAEYNYLLTNYPPRDDSKFHESWQVITTFEMPKSRERVFLFIRRKTLQREKSETVQSATQESSES